MRARIQKISRYAPSIFQGRLEFGSARGLHGRRIISLTVEHPLERVLFRACAGALLVLACACVYFVGTSVLNVIARQEALAQTTSLASAVSELEREYLAVSQNVKPEDGAQLGLTPVSNTVYIHSPGNAVAVTPERNEI